MQPVHFVFIGLGILGFVIWALLYRHFSMKRAQKAREEEEEKERQRKIQEEEALSQPMITQSAPAASLDTSHDNIKHNNSKTSHSTTVSSSSSTQQKPGGAVVSHPSPGITITRTPRTGPPPAAAAGGGSSGYDGVLRSLDNKSKPARKPRCKRYLGSSGTPAFLCGQCGFGVEKQNCVVCGAYAGINEKGQMCMDCAFGPKKDYCCLCEKWLSEDKSEALLCNGCGFGTGKDYCCKLEQ